jgi:hypothetical protein
MEMVVHTYPKQPGGPPIAAAQLMLHLLDFGVIETLRNRRHDERRVGTVTERNGALRSTSAPVKPVVVLVRKVVVIGFHITHPSTNPNCTVHTIF